MLEMSLKGLILASNDMNLEIPIVWYLKHDMIERFYKYL